MSRYLITGLMLVCSVAPATAHVSVNIGINLPVYPQLVQVPAYPVYYAPQLSANYFFYDGMYWVYQGDRWYASSWYNGPWALVAPAVVPVYILRVPVRYYRRPPAYFHEWPSNRPPRWNQHWGNEWAQSRRGWDRWNHNRVPRPAPLPVYQRHYFGDRYPRVEQQQALQSRNYRYQPRDPVVRQHYQAQRVRSTPASAQRETQGAPQERNAGRHSSEGSKPPRTVQWSAPPRPHAPPPRQRVENVQSYAPTHARPQQKGEPPVQQEHQQPAQESHAQASHRRQTGAQGKWAQEPKGRGASQEPNGKGTPQESKHGHRLDPEQDRADAHDGRQDHRSN